MNQLRSYIMLVCIIMLNGCNQNNAEKQDDGSFHKSYISLMPEGEPENLQEFAPINPSVIAWGNDPIGYGLDTTSFSKRILAYKNMGIPLIASNVWMLTATNRYMFQHPEYQDAVCVDIAGDRIIPGWLDSDYRGVKPWWGCTNNPLFRSLVRERAAVGIQSGANMLHLDDHLGTYAAVSHSGGCFCEYCMKGFNKWLATNFNKNELEKKGINDLDNFNYAKLVREAGFLTKDAYLKGVNENKIPLRNSFLSFQRYEAAEFVHELGSMADSIAGKHIPLGVNSWNLDPVQLATSHYADYFSNEVQQYDVEDLIPPFVYMLGNALHKPVFSTGTGEDWIKIKHNESRVRINRWIATAYTFGNYFMYSYNKWGFSEETGTQWYQIPIDMFEPLCTFITENSELFDDYIMYKQVGVIYDNSAFRAGDKISREICRELHYKQIPAGIVPIGGELLKYKISAKDLDEFEYLILPEETPRSQVLSNIIKPYEVNNKLIPWTDDIDIQSVFESPIKVEANKVWAIPRIKEKSNSSYDIVIHLLNQDFDKKLEKMNEKSDFQVFLSKQLLNDQRVSSAEYFIPGQKSIKLNITTKDEGCAINIPSLDVWGIIKIN